MAKSRNPRYAPEALERKLSPSAVFGVPAYSEVATFQPTEPTEPNEPDVPPREPGCPPDPYPPVPVVG